MSIDLITIIPVLQQEVVSFSPKLERLIHTRVWSRIEEFVDDKPLGFGRPGNDRGVLAHAFLSKAILGIPSTVGLVERLSVDKTLRHICGFPVSVVITSASVHDCQVATPLALITEQRVKH